MRIPFTSRREPIDLVEVLARQTKGHTINNPELTRDELLAQNAALSQEVGRFRRESQKLVLNYPREPEAGDAQRLLGKRFPFLNRQDALSTVTTAPGEGADHVLIEADNIAALPAYFASAGCNVDVIYIDPPYNTGNGYGDGGFVYNDAFVSSDSTKYHSSWLSFITPRLHVARSVLRDTGVIMVAIGKDELAHLIITMDDIFGANNRIEIVTWSGVKKNDARFVSGTSDYLLIYAKNKTALVERDVRWRSEKGGVGEMIAKAASIWSEIQNVGAESNSIEATSRFRTWMKSLPKTHDAFADKGTKAYNTIDDSGRIYRTGPLHWPGAGGPRYDVLHPVTGLPVAVPPPGWRYSKEQTMLEMIAAGRIIFGTDHTTQPTYKRYLDEVTNMVITDVIDQDRSDATRELADILGKGPDGKPLFNNPKDVDVIAQWVDYVTPTFRKDESASDPIIVMDFFAGSGTTGHAVLKLNAADNVSRRFVLVTNNEDANAEGGDSATGISRNVTAVRLRNVITGVWADGKPHESFPANLHYYRLGWSMTKIDSNDTENSEMFESRFTGLAALNRSAHHPLRVIGDPNCGKLYDVLTDGVKLVVVWKNHATVMLDDTVIEATLCLIERALPGYTVREIHSPVAEYAVPSFSGWASFTFPGTYINTLSALITKLRGNGSLLPLKRP